MRIFDGDHTSPKGYVGGTHRACAPAVTFEAFRHLMPRLGITRLANVTGLDVIGVPVYMAVRPNSRGLAVSQGKGLDADSAKVSALMESIETWHGERAAVTLRSDSYESLRDDGEVVDVTQVAQRAGSVLRLHVPLLFARGWDLLKGCWTWVPYEAVTTDFTSPRGANVFFMSTNGLASGNHLLEAIAHGLCEVIERDAITLWAGEHPRDSQARLVNLASIDDPACHAVLDRLERAGVSAAVWDITSDIGIPAFASSIFETQARPVWRRIGQFSGFGCHLDARVALMRSLTEAVQIRLTTIAGSRDDLFHHEYLRAGNDDDRSSLWSLTRALRDGAAARPFRSVGARATSSFEGDLEVMLGALRRIGLASAVVVDLTRAEIGVPVVKVIVPGLEAFGRAENYRPGLRARRRQREVVVQ